MYVSIYTKSVVPKKKSILVKNVIFEGHFELQGGKTSVYMKVFVVMHCTTERKVEGWSCFEEAQVSYSLEAKHRDNSCAPSERDG